MKSKKPKQSKLARRIARDQKSLTVFRALQAARLEREAAK